MIPIREWTEDYVLSLPLQEYDNIEFKAPQWINLSDHASKDTTCIGLAKELCALANTGGGQLVLGIKDRKQCKHGVLEVVDGGLAVALDKKDTAEWLRAVIPTLLDYPLISFEVHPLPDNPTSAIVAGKAIFVIDVPNSIAAPHQSKRDNKYYMRVGGNSLPIGHRIVMDIVGRQKFPVLDVRFCIQGTFAEMTRRTEHQPRSREFSIQVTARNTGRLFAQYVNIILSMPPNLVPNVSTWVAKQKVEDGETVCVEHLVNTNRDIIAGEGPHAQRGPSWFDPILPGRERVWEIPLDVRYNRTDWRNKTIRWELFADTAPPVSGVVSVGDIGQTTEWKPDSCPCCAENNIGNDQWNCDCAPAIVPGTPFICSHCGFCTGEHCRCRG